MPEDITVALLFCFVTHSALVADVGFLFVPSPKMDLDFEHFKKKKARRTSAEMVSTAVLLALYILIMCKNIQHS